MKTVDPIIRADGDEDAPGETVAALKRKLAREIERREHAEAMLADRLEDLMGSRRRVESESSLLFRCMETMSDGIAFTDSAGVYTYMNPAHLALFGYTDQTQVVGRHWSILYDEEVLDWMSDRLFPELTANGSWRGDLIGRAVDGRPVYQDVSLTLVPEGIICSTRDASVRNQLEEERSRLQAIIDDVKARQDAALFGVQIAHDISNIVAAIRINAELLGPLGPAQTIIRATDRVNEITAQLSASGRRESAATAPFDLGELLVEVSDLGRSLVRHPVKVIPEIDADLRGVRADADRALLHRTLLNLVKNAAEATIGDGAIRVRLSATGPEERPPRSDIVAFGEESEDPSLWISVQDAGAGMSSATLRRLAKPQSSTKDSLDGAPRGLGMLSLAAFVQLHGCYAQVQSRRGTGTTVQLQIVLSSRYQQD